MSKLYHDAGRYINSGRYLTVSEWARARGVSRVSIVRDWLPRIRKSVIVFERMVLIPLTAIQKVEEAYAGLREAMTEQARINREVRKGKLPETMYDPVWKKRPVPAGTEEKK